MTVVQETDYASEMVKMNLQTGRDPLIAAARHPLATRTGEAGCNVQQIVKEYRQAPA